MAKKVLVLYYSQSGQLRTILDNILHDIADNVEVNYVTIEPQKPFPLPWKAQDFFDAMPESVELVPVEVKPLPEAIMNTDYDLVFFGYQPWFLSPSIPITSFLKSEYATVLKNKPVITVIGSRNMWLNAQEKVKEMLLSIGAKLVANIAFVDTNPNLVSVLSIMRWAFKGQKEASSFLPEAGVQSRDIEAAKRFGMPIYEHIEGDRLAQLHKELLLIGSVNINSGLVILEKRGVKNFRKFAKYIREKGGAGAPERQGRVNLFKRLLAIGIFVLSPISSFTATIQQQLQKRSLKKDVEYFKETAYEPNRL